jgi:hypothetical protein
MANGAVLIVKISPFLLSETVILRVAVLLPVGLIILQLKSPFTFLPYNSGMNWKVTCAKQGIKLND